MKLAILPMAVLTLAGCATSVSQPIDLSEHETKPPFVKPVTQVSSPPVSQGAFIAGEGKSFVFGEKPMVEKPEVVHPKVTLKRLPRSADTPQPKASPPPEESRASAVIKAVVRSEIGVHFNFDSHELSQAAKSQLLLHIEDLKSAGEIALHGHTDNVGGTNYNLVLSLKRAESVKQFLQAQGVKSPFALQGIGSREPVADNRSTEGRAKNRRVIVIY